jgi:hypothetical protein
MGEFNGEQLVFQFKGKIYQLVNRIAEIGELIRTTNGDVVEVVEVLQDVIKTRDGYYYFHSEYKVLVPFNFKQHLIGLETESFKDSDQRAKLVDAIEKVLELLKRGGAGTRSQVQHILEEVLEEVGVKNKSGV